MYRKILSAAAVLSLLGGAVQAGDIALEHIKDNAQADAEEIIEMRGALAKTLTRPGPELTEDDFKKVCGAVGKRVQEITGKEGVRIRHAAIRFRNPDNEATPEEAALIKRFDSDRRLKDLWEDVKTGGKAAVRYSRPIYVEKACLACHGKKEERPGFVIDKYPGDRAYGFDAGDLRGIISVTAPLE